VYTCILLKISNSSVEPSRDIAYSETASALGRLPLI
jgi:hypothetical protein